MKRSIPFVIVVLFALLLSSCFQEHKSKSSIKLMDLSFKDSVLLYEALTIASSVQRIGCDSSLCYYARALDIARKAGSCYGQLKCYDLFISLGVLCRQNQAISKHIPDSLLSICRNEKNWNDYTYYAEYIKATYCQVNNNLDLATDFYINSMKHNLKDTLIYTLAASNIAQISAQQKNYNLAIKYQQIFIDYSLKARKNYGALLGYLNLYEFNFSIKDTISALKNLNNAKDIIIKNPRKFFDGATIYYYDKANYYSYINLNDSAILFYDSTLSNLSQSKTSYISSGLPMTGKAFCLFKQKKYIEANLIFNTIAIDSPNETFADADRIKYYELSWQLAEQNQQMEQANKALKRQIEIGNQMTQTEKKEQLMNFEKELKKAAAEMTINDKNNVISKQKNYLIFSRIIAFLVISGFITFVLYIKNKRRLERVKHQLDLQIAQTEERNRIAQEMHDDLGSNLTSISMGVTMVKQNPQDTKALNLIESSSNELGQLVNEIVWSLNLRNDNLQSLVSYIRQFANSFLREISIKLAWDEDGIDESITIDGYKRRAIFLTAKEIINNIGKHSNATTVNIEAHYKNNLFYMTIKDDGTGFEEEHIITKIGGGNGLKNLRLRIQKLKGEINWINQNGTQVNIKIPL